MFGTILICSSDDYLNLMFVFINFFFYLTARIILNNFRMIFLEFVFEGNLIVYVAKIC